MSVEVNPRGFEIRRINVGQELGCAGYGVEILDGGVGGYQNKLVLGRGLFGTTQAHPEDSQIPCVPGNRVISTFDFLRLKQDTVTVIPSEIDSVLVKVHTTRTAVFTDTPHPGFVKKQWLARGSIVVANGSGSAQRIWKTSDYANGIPVDDYHTDPQLSVQGFWDGFVITSGATTWAVYVVAAYKDQDATGVYRPVQIFAPHDFSALNANYPTNATHTVGSCVDFAMGTASTTTAGTSIMARYPGGQVEVWIVNTGAAPATFEYLLGVRGHM